MTCLELLKVPLVGVSVMVDDTTNVSNLEQMSLCLKYMKSDFSVSETFWGFIETPTTTGESMYKQLSETLNALGLSIDKCGDKDNMWRQT